MKKICKNIKDYFYESNLFIRSFPSGLMAIFITSIIAMNLLANKSIDFNSKYLALDLGIILSWIVFIVMDIVTKRYGPREGIMISIFGLLINFGFAIIFFIASIIPGTWSSVFDYDVSFWNMINKSIDSIFKGTWYVLLGSSIAFFISAIVNCYLNYLIGKLFKKNPNSFIAFALRSYVSTAIGQFVDNLVFALIVSKIFFGWTSIQCFVCALTGMCLELLFEIIFSPLGYKIVKRLEKNKVGEEYLTYIKNKRDLKNE